MKKNHFKKFLALFFVLIVGSSVFYACKKSTDVENNEPFSLDNYKSTHLKPGVTETDVQNVLKKSVLLYNNRALEDILNDLVGKNKITPMGRANILASIQGKTQAQFVKEALQRISNSKQTLSLQLKKTSYTNPLSTTQPGPFEPLNDSGYSAYEQQLMFDYIVLELTNKGISWECAGAIAGVGLTIAGLFIGGPATVAAAALWGASHVLAVVNLVACAPKHKSYVEDIKNQFATEQDFIDYFQNNISNNGPLEWTEIPGIFSDGFQTDLFLNGIMTTTGISRILVQPYNESLPSLMDADDGNWHFFNGTTGILVLNRSSLLVAHNLSDLTSYTIRNMWITGSPLQEAVLVIRLRN